MYREGGDKTQSFHFFLVHSHKILWKMSKFYNNKCNGEIWQLLYEEKKIVSTKHMGGMISFSLFQWKHALIPQTRNVQQA